MSSDSVVVLVTVDSLRKDHLECYNPGLSLTPFMSSLTEHCITFKNAFSQGGGTPESFPSIMCSLPPPLSLDGRSVKGAKSIAKSLKEAGYNTGAFHSNPFLSSSFGYDEGFDFFFEGFPQKVSLPTAARDLGHAANVLLNKAPIVNGRTISRKAIDWLKRCNGPTFLWVHYMDAHFPYLPPWRSQGFLASMQNRMQWEFRMARRIQNRPTKVSEATKRSVISSYDACVRTVDSCLAFLVPEIQKRFQKHLLILTSDHGESFWEHGYFGHSGIYDEILKVPLLVSTNNAGSQSNPDIVLLSDIMPTIMHHEGLEAVTENNLLGPKNASDSHDRRFVATSLDPPRGTRTVGMRTSSFKYIRKEKTNGELESEELYDLNTDAGERTNIVMRRSEDAGSARDYINKVYANTTESARLSKEDENEINQRLRALGYM